MDSDSCCQNQPNALPDTPAESIVSIPFVQPTETSPSTEPIDFFLFEPEFTYQQSEAVKLTEAILKLRTENQSFDKLTDAYRALIRFYNWQQRFEDEESSLLDHFTLTLDLSFERYIELLMDVRRFYLKRKCTKWGKLISLLKQVRFDHRIPTSDCWKMFEICAELCCITGQLDSLKHMLETPIADMSDLEFTNWQLCLQRINSRYTHNSRHSNRYQFYSTAENAIWVLFEEAYRRNPRSFLSFTSLTTFLRGFRDRIFVESDERKQSKMRLSIVLERLKEISEQCISATISDVFSIGSLASYQKHTYLEYILKILDRNHDPNGIYNSYLALAELYVSKFTEMPETAWKIVEFALMREDSPGWPQTSKCYVLAISILRKRKEYAKSESVMRFIECNHKYTSCYSKCRELGSIRNYYHPRFS